jgi:hypothetical protein
LAQLSPSLLYFYSYLKTYDDWPQQKVTNELAKSGNRHEILLIYEMELSLEKIIAALHAYKGMF